MMKYVACLAFLVFYSASTMASGLFFNKLTTNAVLINFNAPGKNQVEGKGNYFKPRLNRVDAATRSAILSYERKRKTRYSPAVQRLSRCDFIGALVELDNLSGTKEQVVTYANGCQQSPNKLKTVWLLQSKKAGSPTVLIADRGSMLRIPKPRRNGFRSIEFKSTGQLTVGVERKRHTASCRKTWNRNGGRYRASPEVIRVWGRSALMPASPAWYKLPQLYPHLKSRLPKACPKN
ncbi:MAG: hypothetical protein ACPG47_02615 [Leucothrix sp.]